MSDPKRIDRILALVKEYWRLYPSLRLGQLIGNCCDSRDYYYANDEDLERRLIKLVSGAMVKEAAPAPLDPLVVEALEHAVEELETWIMEIKTEL